MTALITLDRNRSPRDRAQIAASRGRAPRQLAASYNADLAALGKAIVLCGACVGKFDADKNGYVTEHNIPFVRGRCDGCNDPVDQGRLFLHQDKLPA